MDETKPSGIKMNFIKAIILTISFLLIKGTAAQDANKIIGGVEVERERYPYMVGLRNDNGMLFCGGTLIDPFWVLTAARCANRFSKVEIGRIDRQNKTEEYELIEIDFESPHLSFRPEPNFGNNDHDIMLVRLKQASTFTPVTMDDGSADVSTGRNVTVMGWGTTNAAAVLPNNLLLEADIQIQDKDSCTTSYANVNVPITGNMICASAPGKDACTGDAGGPLIIKGDNSTQDILVGFFSFNFGCATENYPGVYTYVRAMRTFIDFITQCPIPSGFECCEARCRGGIFECQQSTCDLSDDVFCVDSSLPSDPFEYDKCEAEFPCYLGDGYCDDGLYNTPECNYDGGDCCNFTCADNTYNCSGNAFDTCKDSPPVDVDSVLDQIRDLLQEILGLFEDVFTIVVALLGIDIEWPF